MIAKIVNEVLSIGVVTVLVLFAMSTLFGVWS